MSVASLNGRIAAFARASAIGVADAQVLPFSTGVIMETLPVERIEAALRGTVAALAPANGARWAEAAPANKRREVP